MKKLLTIALLALAGCASGPTLEPKIAERVEYLVRIPPEEMLTLPVQPANIDPDKATQADVARWIIANEKFLNELRAKFSAIAKFLKSAQDKADDEAHIANIANGTATPKIAKKELPSLAPLSKPASAPAK